MIVPVLEHLSFPERLTRIQLFATLVLVFQNLGSGGGKLGNSGILSVGYLRIYSPVNTGNDSVYRSDFFGIIRWMFRPELISFQPGGIDSQSDFI